MGDGGLALGAAVVAAAQAGDAARPRSRAPRPRARLTTTTAIEAALRAAGLDADAVSELLACRVADLLADGRIVMWFQGRMEYGPRALGHRSVLARPDRPRAARSAEPGAQAARLVSAVLSRACSRAKAPRLLADWTGGRQPVR